MNISDLTSKKNKITSLLETKQLSKAFNAIKSLSTETNSWDLQDEIMKLETSYKYMIQFFIAGSDDPQRNCIYNGIIESLYTLTDKVIYSLSRNDSTEQYYIAKRLLPKFATSLDSVYNNYLKQKLQTDLYSEVTQDQADKNKEIQLLKNVEETENTLFNYVWTSFPVSTTEMQLLSNIITDDATPQHLKVLLISAIYLNICQFYQESLVALLFNVYSSNSDIKVCIISLCCAIIAVQKYSDRIQTTSSISNIIQSMIDNTEFCKDVRTIFFILTRSRDTERLNRKVQNDLMPEIMKISPNIIKKFKSDMHSFNDFSEFEGNPEWQNILDNSGITKKIEELNEIQMEGGDVFLSTFAKLKSFPFFSKISNWFVPFLKNRSIVLEIFSEKDMLLKEIIANARFLCNSDKYSFCLSLQSVPQSQRELMLTQFDAQNSSIQELKALNLPDPAKEHEIIANKFIQDLFRFSKLHNNKNEFYDPFSSASSLLSIELLQPILNDKDTLILIGEYYLKNEHYSEAISCFNLITDFDNYPPAITQKIGFCHQCLKEYDKAIDSYLKYDLFNSNDIWNLRHIATCYKALHNLSKSLLYYRKAEAIAPDNLNICLNIGHCLLEMGKTEDALKAYYKADYIDASKHRAIRPIAWCSLLLSNFSQSHEYYKKVLTDNPTAQDFLNIGHLYLCEHNYAEALNFYKQSVELFNNDLKTFIQCFNNDNKTLTEKGLTELELNLMIDKLLYDKNSI